MKETVFFHFILLRQFLHFFMREISQEQFLFVKPDAGKVFPSLMADARAGRRTEANVVSKVPILLVVPRTEAFPREAGDLVALHAVVREDPAHGLVHGPALFLGGTREPPPLCQLRHAGALLQDEAVDGHVGDRKVHGPANAFLEVFHALPRKLIHEVHADIMKSQAIRPLHRRPRFRRCVKATDGAKEAIIMGLDAHREAIHPQRFRRAKVCLAHVTGIHFHGDFRILRNMEISSKRGEYIPKLRCRK